MIRAEGIRKTFGCRKAINNITVTIQEGNIFGLVGTNGAGKSTFLRILSGVLKPEAGTVTIDELPVFENEKAKAKICFLSDTAYFFSGATPKSMAHYYGIVYPEFDKKRFDELLNKFGMEQEDRDQYLFQRDEKAGFGASGDMHQYPVPFL